MNLLRVESSTIRKSMKDSVKVLMKGMGILTSTIYQISRFLMLKRIALIKMRHFPIKEI